MYDSILPRYQRVDDKSRITLIYLILHNYDLDKIEKIYITNDDFAERSKLKRCVGITSEYVDVEEINKELDEIVVPIVYSPAAFNEYAKAEYVYCYRAKEPDMPLYINDLNVISPMMVIEKDCIISSNLAEPVESANCKGLMYFVDYIVKGKCTIGKWDISFKDKTFLVEYTSKDRKGEDVTELLYRGEEMDITPTFKLVLYIIKKVAEEMDVFSPDNFAYEKMKRRESM